MQYKGIIDAINKATTIAVISHINPDGDTTGSGLALYKALQMYGKKPYIFCDNEISGKIEQLPLTDRFNSEYQNKYDISIAVDCADKERLGDSISEFNKGKIKIVIDHHKTNARFGDLNYIVPNASATAEIMYNIVRELNCIDSTVARLLYSGLVTDSGGFTYSSVTPETMRVAGELLKYDINAHEICEHFLKKIRYNVFKLKTKVLNNAEFYENNKIGIITFRMKDFEDTDTDSSCTDGIINNIRDIDGVLIAVSIAEVKDKSFKVSFRTGEEIDSSRMAMVFGGGGHKNAAGCRISGYYEDVLDKILKVTRDEIC